MVLVRLVDSRVIMDPHGRLFWGVKFHDHCDNIVVNPFLDLKFSFTVYPMDSV